MNVLLAVLLVANFAGLIASVIMTAHARREIRDLLRSEERAIRVMHNAAVQRGEVIALHSRRAPLGGSRSRPPLDIVS